MKKLLLLLIPAFFLTACEELDGLLNVHEQFSMLNKKGVELNLLPGTFDSELKITKKKLRVKIKDLNGKDQKFYFKVPSGVVLPKYQGEAVLPNNLSGQPVDLKMVANTDTVTSDLIHDTESCTYTRRRMVCHGHRRHRDCYWVTDTIYGYQQVEYKVVTNTKVVDVLFLEPASQTQMAEFDATKISHYRDYTYKGPCR